MSSTTKEYLKSSLITFIAAFCIAVLPEINGLTLEGIKAGALIGIAFAGIRAGVKALIEGFLFWYSNRSNKG